MTNLRQEWPPAWPGQQFNPNNKQLRASRSAQTHTQTQTQTHTAGWRASGASQLLALGSQLSQAGPTGRSLLFVCFLVKAMRESVCASAMRHSVYLRERERVFASQCLSVGRPPQSACNLS